MNKWGMAAVDKESRIVVFHQGALGDFLVTVPVVEGLCAAWPKAGAAGNRIPPTHPLTHSPTHSLSVDFWSKPEHVALLEGKSYAGECHSLEGPLIASLLRDGLWNSVPLPYFLLGASQVFIFGQSGARTLAERLSARLDGQVHWVRSFPAEKIPPGPPLQKGGTSECRIHVSEFLRKQISDLGYGVREIEWVIEPSLHELQNAARMLEELGTQKPVLVHPGSGGRKKVWPLMRWQALLRWMRDELHLPVLLSVGPADEYLDDFARGMETAGVPVIRGLSAAVLSALLSMCSLYLGSDSGVSHLAAAVGIPTIAVFGPTDPDVWGPRGRDVHILRRSWSDLETLDWGTSQAPPDAEMAGIVMVKLFDG